MNKPHAHKKHIQRTETYSLNSQGKDNDKAEKATDQEKHANKENL